MKRMKIVGKITDIKFKSRSAEGCPSFYVTFEDINGNKYRGYTTKNADANYGIKNEEYWKWSYITFHYTNNGSTIVDYLTRIYPIDKINFRYSEHQFSRNCKKNKLCSDMYRYILSMHINYDNSYAELLDDLKRYKRDYPDKVDYNYLDDGNLFCYLDEAQKCLEAHGYKTNRMNQQQMWDKFRPIVRTVIDFILEHEMEIV